ncbi:MAG: hypothetical protein M1828_005806, partial [Chrysothrix sp. TS-e1954]
LCYEGLQDQTGHIEQAKSDDTRDRYGTDKCKNSQNERNQTVQGNSKGADDLVTAISSSIRNPWPNALLPNSDMIDASFHEAAIQNASIVSHVLFGESPEGV